MLFITINCAFKLSLWRWWQRAVYCIILGAFVWWSQRYAILQSKTQIADYLQNTVALQNMAIVVTAESVFCFGFVACLLQDMYAVEKPRWWARLLWWYPSLLMFPVMFYALTQTIFAAVGTDFTVTSIALAVATVVILPLLAEGAKWLVPDAEGRVETHLLLTCFVCALGLLSTQNGKMVYHVKETAVDLKTAVLPLLVFILLFAVGFLASRLKWRLSRRLPDQTGRMAKQIPLNQ